MLNFLSTKLEKYIKIDFKLDENIQSKHLSVGKRICECTCLNWNFIHNNALSCCPKYSVLVNTYERKYIFKRFRHVEIPLIHIYVACFAYSVEAIASGLSIIIEIMLF